MLELRGLRGRESASLSHSLVLIENLFPVSFAAFDEEDLNGVAWPDAVCQQRWTDRPEPHLIVLGEIWPAVPDSGSLADAVEGCDELIENPLSDVRSEVPIDMFENATEPVAGRRGEEVVGHSALLVRASGIQ